MQWDKKGAKAVWIVSNTIEKYTYQACMVRRNVYLIIRGQIASKKKKTKTRGKIDCPETLCTSASKYQSAFARDVYQFRLLKICLRTCQFSLNRISYRLSPLQFTNNIRCKINLVSPIKNLSQRDWLTENLPYVKVIRSSTNVLSIKYLYMPTIFKSITLYESLYQFASDRHYISVI